MSDKQSQSFVCALHQKYCQSTAEGVDFQSYINVTLKFRREHYVTIWIQFTDHKKIECITINIGVKHKELSNQ